MDHIPPWYSLHPPRSFFYLRNGTQAPVIYAIIDFSYRHSQFWSCQGCREFAEMLKPPRIANLCWPRPIPGSGIDGITRIAGVTHQALQGIGDGNISSEYILTTAPPASFTRSGTRNAQRRGQLAIFREHHSMRQPPIYPLFHAQPRQPGYSKRDTTTHWLLSAHPHRNSPTLTSI